MAMKPIDIRRKEFKQGIRGYAANQVDDFLDSVADEYESVYTENARMKEEITSLRERLEQFEELEGSIQAALVHAEQAANDLRESSSQEADNTRRNAQHEAEITLKEAKTRAHNILADSSSRAERVQESYEALREARQTFAADFRHLLRSYLEVMDNVDIASAKEIEASLRERLDTESLAVAREAARQSEEAEGPSADEDDTRRIQPELSAESEEETTTAESETPVAEEHSGEPPEESSEEPSEESTTEHGTAESEAVEDSESEDSESEESATASSSGYEERESSEQSQEEPEESQEEPESPAESQAESQEEDSSSGGQEEGSSSGEDSSGEEGDDSRFFRASRFLRRRE